MNKIWNYIFKKSREKLIEQNKKNSGIDLKCKGCNYWISDPESHDRYKIVKHEEYGIELICGVCGTVSYFNTHMAPLPLPCDENGIPL